MADRTEAARVDQVDTDGVVERLDAPPTAHGEHLAARRAAVADFARPVLLQLAGHAAARLQPNREEREIAERFVPTELGLALQVFLDLVEAPREGREVRAQHQVERQLRLELSAVEHEPEQLTVRVVREVGLDRVEVQVRRQRRRRIERTPTAARVARPRVPHHAASRSVDVRLVDGEAYVELALGLGAELRVGAHLRRLVGDPVANCGDGLGVVDVFELPRAEIVGGARRLRVQLHALGGLRDEHLRERHVDEGRRRFLLAAQALRHVARVDAADLPGPLEESAAGGGEH